MSLIKFEDIEQRILTVRDTQVILDSDVAVLYGVETKRINEAVKNNPQRFPDNYIIELDKAEIENLRSKISTSSWGGRRYAPKAFTEKGLYMLATILNSNKAVETTLSIIETFARFKELSRTFQVLTEVKDESTQKTLLQKSSELLGEILDSNLETSDTETSIELNLALIKLKHTIKKKK